MVAACAQRGRVWFAGMLLSNAKFVGGRVVDRSFAIVVRLLEWPHHVLPHRDAALGAGDDVAEGPVLVPWLDCSHHQDAADAVVAGIEGGVLLT